MHVRTRLFLALCATMLLCAAQAFAQPGGERTVYNPGQLKSRDSATHLKVGDQAPDFTLPSLDKSSVSLSSFKGTKNVVISFVPAAFTPVCSEQWPGYNLAREEIMEHDAVILGISTDNTPSQYAWTQQMGGVWFPVLSDFHPQGRTAELYGVLRSDGTAERATFIVDKNGIIRFIDVHDINEQPRIGDLLEELGKLPR